MDLISVVVTTKNSSRTLERCLSSVRRQDYPSVEVVVVDNESTDTTGGIARRFADVVLTAGPERSAQRNAGIRASTGVYVCIIDSDMYLEPNVLSACLRAITLGEAVAIPERSIGEGFWASCKSFERSFYLSDAMTAAARFFRRKTIEQHGLYDESLTGPEDWDMSMRVAGSAGVVFADAIILHDEGRLQLLPLLHKKYYYGRSMPQFVGKHGSLARKRLSPFRGSLVRALPRVLANPVIGLATVAMKVSELGALSLGTMDRRAHRPETVYQAKPHA